MSFQPNIYTDHLNALDNESVFNQALYSMDTQWIDPDFFIANQLNTLLPMSPPLTHDSALESTPEPAVLFPTIPDTSTPPPLRRLVPKPIMPKTAHMPLPVQPPKRPVYSEESLLKRKKNTDAARRSRLRKMMKMQTLQQKAIALEAERAQLKTRLAVLESKKEHLVSKDQSHQERIRILEQQLTEAHRALGH